MFEIYLKKLKILLKEHECFDKRVQVKIKTLSKKEAIGEPTYKDFPLLKGREVMLEAGFKDYIGHAFTDMPLKFDGSFKELFASYSGNTKERALIVAATNAFLKSINYIDKTIHCKNEEPELCAGEIVNYFKSKTNGENLRIALIGLQPAFLDKLGKAFEVRVVDLDPENIGKIKYDILVEDGNKNLKDVIDWSNIVLATGSSIVNGTIDSIFKYSKEKGKELVFFGVTIAGASKILNLKRVCFYGH